MKLFSTTSTYIMKGRWAIDYDPLIMYRKVDLANEDNSLMVKIKEEKYTLEIVGCFSEFH
jgi:hypothetical protein